MDVNSVMRTFLGKGFTGNAFFGVHNNDSIREHRVMMSFGKDSTQRVSPHSEVQTGVDCTSEVKIAVHHALPVLVQFDQ